jgi:D-glycero-D-manno-heptose 1,7-bisphosphate phosphatase
VGEYLRESFDRKPNPGMLLRAKSEFDLDLADSMLVGDKDSDIQAGIAAGVGANLKLVHGDSETCPEAIASLQDVGLWLMKRYG